MRVERCGWRHVWLALFAVTFFCLLFPTVSGYSAEHFPAFQAHTSSIFVSDRSTDVGTAVSAGTPSTTSWPLPTFGVYLRRAGLWLSRTMICLDSDKLRSRQFLFIYFGLQQEKGKKKKKTSGPSAAISASFQPSSFSQIHIVRRRK